MKKTSQTAAIAEALIQFHWKNSDGLPLIELFPTLPEDWENGSITGLCTCFGLVIDLSWNHTTFCAEFKAEKNVSFECHGEIYSVNTGESIKVIYTKTC